MRWSGVFALVALALGCASEPPAAGQVSLVLDVAEGMFEPRGFSALDVIVHEADGDVVRSTTLRDGAFDLGTIEPSQGAWIEVTLRNTSGAVVGYGRTSASLEFGKGSEIVVPVRRPIVYFAGIVARDEDADPEIEESWSSVPATFSDLSVSAPLDGTTQVGTTQAVLTIAAGPDLYLVSQATSNPAGALVGPAQVMPVSAADHAAAAALPGTMTGAVLDGAGSDDGSLLVIGTQTQLFMVDTAAGSATALADGSFARVAITTTETGDIKAFAIKNRGSTTAPCAPQAELWAATLRGAGAGPARMVATGGFTDVASDRGQAYYIDGCTGELGRIDDAGVAVIRQIAGATSPSRATVLAVSNGQGYVGVETAPATTSLLVLSTEADEAPRVLWTEVAQQVLEAFDFPGVQRQLDAESATVEHLELGAGGRYVALTTRARFDGEPVAEANFPEMTIETEELRVFDGATGGVVQRYRSWCSGVLGIFDGDIEDWACASTTGQSAAALDFDHHINSMTFVFGKK